MRPVSSPRSILGFLVLLRPSCGKDRGFFIFQECAVWREYAALRSLLFLPSCLFSCGAVFYSSVPLFNNNNDDDDDNNNNDLYHMHIISIISIIIIIIINIMIMIIIIIIIT